MYIRVLFEGYGRGLGLEKIVKTKKGHLLITFRAIMSKKSLSAIFETAKIENMS